MRRERRQPTRAEWEAITSRKPVVMRIPPVELRRLVKDATDSHMEPWRLQQFRMVEREERQTLKSMFGGAA
jgi:hypothetical protein